MAIPYVLSPNKINTVFKSILDNYGYDKSKWRIAHYTNDGTASADYKEYLSGLDQIDPGKGYWIIVRNEQDITFEKGNTVNTNGGPFEIELHSGWNQIGNPYDFNVSWSDILVFNSDKGDTLAQIESYKTFKAGAFVDINTIDKFRGGFVRYNGTKPIKLKIPFTQDASINSGRVAAGKSFPSDLSEKEWRIALDLSSGEIKNKISSFGMHPKGTDGEDERDEHRLPAFVRSLDVAFPHSLSTSVVATSDNHTWEFDVFNTTGSKEISLNWDNTSFGDNDRELFLHDRAGERLIDMREQNNYTFTYQEGHHFNIYFGDRSYIEDQSRPGVIVLSDAYPNPMKGTTTIPFTVTQDQTHVQLAIYDLQGKEITSLVNNTLATGFYEVEWDGRSAAGEQLSSGVVMYGLHTSQPGSASRSVVKKLMIAP
ncbi:MAG: hypothetical protein C0490_18675 [Marivirga sp.]|nr:hypothetical protein [Marivirga sp.]